MLIPNEVSIALEKLNSFGYEAFMVGGCVRDKLLGLEPKDYDITTNATPENLKEIFKDYKTLDIGLKHGTLTVIINNTPLEITTYRVEGAYSDNRRPDYVSFTSNLEEDVKRRDFTVNALCYNPNIGVVDYCGGREDLNKNIIRCVGNPKERFLEDSLRILRALRFASCYGFEIEEETKKAIFETKELLCNIAKERIAVEFNKLICGKNAYKILMDFYSVFVVLFPEFKNAKGFCQYSPWHIYDIWEHTAKTVEAIEMSKICRLTMFFHDLGKVYTFSKDEKGIGHFYNHANVSCKLTEEILTRYKYDNETKENVLKLIKYHDLVLENNQVQIKKLLSKLGEKQFFNLLKVKNADTAGQTKELSYRYSIVEQISKTAQKVLEEAQCFSLKDLALNGNDLTLLGLKGKEIGAALNLLLEKVISNELENSKEKLLEYVKDLH